MWAKIFITFAHFHSRKENMHFNYIISFCIRMYVFFICSKFFDDDSKASSKTLYIREKP